METKTFMAIGGHVGDMELTVGGVLSTLSLSGHRIVTVALTAGEKGNPPHLTTDEYRKQKIDEAAAFATMLGGISEVLPYDDGLLPVDDTVKFQVADLIRKYKPVRIFTHWQNSFHKDHKACNQIVKDAQFYAAPPWLPARTPATLRRRSLLCGKLGGRNGFPTIRPLQDSTGGLRTVAKGDPDPVVCHQQQGFQVLRILLFSQGGKGKAGKVRLCRGFRSRSASQDNRH